MSVTTLRHRLPRPSEIKAGLCQALKRGEFELYYQEIRSLNAPDRIGLEALLRWHRRSGLEQPGEFLPAAETAGLMGEIGGWVLRQACAEMQVVNGSLRNGQVSVNVSASQMSDAGILTQVQQALKSSGMAPSRLALEITETAIIEDLEFTGRCLRQLTALGVEVCIDDFGAGYSSLSWLLHLPISRIKIAHSFVSLVPQMDEAATIVGAIVHMAHDLGLQVVAEGIETADQLRYLQEIHCDFGQGYYFSRPAPLVELMTDTASDSPKGLRG